MRKHLLNLIILAFLLPSVSWSQKMIKGTVTSASDKLGVPGVNIIIKEIPGTGTITDFDGNYTLQVPAEGKTLIFKYVGMETQEVPIGNNPVINVIMKEESKMLEGVIVTAIGIKSERKSLGYAAQDLKGDDLNATRDPNIVNALGSKIAGVAVTSSSGTPGAASKITIRGHNSLLGENGPLFVVDGVPIDNSFDGSSTSDRSNRAIDLNNDDIESVTVLKGPAATALYGIRATGGAVVITTKKGSGKGTRKFKIEFGTQFSIDQVNKLPEKQKKYVLGSNGNIAQPDAFGGTNLSWGAFIDTCRFDGVAWDYDPNGRVVGMSSAPAGAKAVKPYDNVENFFQNALNANHYLSLSGAHKMGNYYFSLGRLDQTGVIPLSNFRRTTFKMTGDIKPIEKLKLSASLSYTNSGGLRNQRGSNASGVVFGLMRCNEMFDLANGVSDPVNNRRAYMLGDTAQRTFYGDIDNPYWSINMNKVKDNVNRYLGFAQADYKVMDGLNLTYRFGMDNYSETVKDYLSDYSKDNYNVGLLYFDTTIFKSYNSDFIMSFDKDINEDINIQVVAGHNYYVRRREYNSAGGEDFITQGIYELSNMRTVYNPVHALTRYRIAGIYYDIKFSYKKFIYLSTTGRNDWSSTLPKDNNSFFYPAVSLGFIFTEPLGLTDNPIFSFGKLRVNYAEVGKDAPPLSLTTLWAPSDSVHGNPTYSLDNSMGNMKIKPEKTKSYEAGIDLRFFQNRISVDFTYYRMNNNEQIVPINVPASSGGTSLLVNVGKLRNQGIELQVGVTPVKSNDFNWDIWFNFSKNKSEVIELYGNMTLLPVGSTYGVSSTENVFIKGQPYGVIYGSRWLRDSLNRIVVGPDGFPKVDPVRGIVGNPNPDWLLGIRNSLSYKGLSFTFLFDFRHGGDIYNGTVGVMKSLGTHISTLNRNDSLVYNGVVAENGYQPNTKKIRYADFYQRYGRTGVSEANIEDGSWVRLKEVGITYRIGKDILKSVPIEAIDLGFTGRNLLLFTSYSGLDPDTNLSGASNSFGRDYFNNPNTRSFSFNLKLTF